MKPTNVCGGGGGQGQASAPREDEDTRAAIQGKRIHFYRALRARRTAQRPEWGGGIEGEAAGGSGHRRKRRLGHGRCMSSARRAEHRAITRAEPALSSRAAAIREAAAALTSRAAAIREAAPANSVEASAIFVEAVAITVDAAPISVAAAPISVAAAPICAKLLTTTAPPPNRSPAGPHCSQGLP